MHRNFSNQKKNILSKTVINQLFSDDISHTDFSFLKTLFFQTAGKSDHL